MTLRATAAALAVGLLALTACGGRGDDATGNAAAVRDDGPDGIEAQADELDAKADNLRDADEAIDDGDAAQSNATGDAGVTNTR